MASLVGYDGLNVRAELKDGKDLVVRVTAMAHYGNRSVSTPFDLDPADYDKLKAALTKVAESIADKAETKVMQAAYAAMQHAEDRQEDIV